MKKNILSYWGMALTMATMAITSCSDDKDLDGKLDEVITISSITVANTNYDAGDNTICMLKNQELQLSAEILPEGVFNPNIVWSSSDESIVTITTDGKIVTKDKAGEAIIHVTPEIGFGPSAATPSRTVKVMDHFVFMESISVTNIPTEAIAAGDEYQLQVSSLPENVTFKRYKYESDNTQIATVDKNGLVKGVSKGKVTIKVIADDMNPGTSVFTSFEMEIKVVVPIEGLQFTEDAELSALGYGEEYQVKYTLEPADATASLLTWTSDNEGVVSVDKTGKLKVHAMGTGSAVITASYGPITKSVNVTVVDGRLCYSFANGLEYWFLDGNKASVLSSDAEKTVVQMGPGYRGDLWLAKNNSGRKVNIAPAVYRYLAVKVGFKSELVPGKNKPNGCIKLEIYDEGVTNIGPEYWGTAGDANNRYAILDDAAFSTTQPNILYYDLQARYKTVTPTNWDQIFSLVQFKFVIADFPESAQTYDMYWVRSFKTLDELREFVDNENNK